MVVMLNNMPLFTLRKALRFASLLRRPAPSSSIATLSILNHVRPETVQHLRQHGYAVEDNVLPLHHASYLLSEIQTLINRNHTTPNKTHIISPSSTASTTYRKAAVLQAELPTLPESIHHTLPYLFALQNDPSLCALLNVYWPSLSLRDQSVKVQRASGNYAAFPIHLDSSPTHDYRILTALLYPHASWSSPDGSLRLQVTPLSFVDIVPKPGRLILLASTLMHHRVLPTAHDRFAITMWLSGTVKPQNRTPPTFQNLQEQIAYNLLAPKFRDLTFRLLLAEQWQTSLIESHPPKEAQQLVDQFSANLRITQQRLPIALVSHLELEQSCLPEVEQLIHDPQALRQTYEGMQKHWGYLPFLW